MSVDNPITDVQNDSAVNNEVQNNNNENGHISNALENQQPDEIQSKDENDSNIPTAVGESELPNETQSNGDENNNIPPSLESQPSDQTQSDSTQDNIPDTLSAQLPNKYGKVQYLDLSDEKALAKATMYRFCNKNCYLETIHLVGFSNNPANQFNGLPIVHVFPANVDTANVPPSLQHMEGGGGLAVPYESGQKQFFVSYKRRPQAFPGITNPTITVIGFPTVSYQSEIDLEDPKCAAIVFEHFIAGMYFQLAHANLCIPVVDADLEQFVLPDTTKFPELTFPKDRRAAFGGGVNQTFLKKYGQLCHEQLFAMDCFANQLAAAKSNDEQEAIINALPLAYQAAFRAGCNKNHKQFYGPFSSAQLPEEVRAAAKKKFDAKHSKFNEFHWSSKDFLVQQPLVRNSASTRQTYRSRTPIMQAEQFSQPAPVHSKVGQVVQPAPLYQVDQSRPPAPLSDALFKKTNLRYGRILNLVSQSLGEKPETIRLALIRYIEQNLQVLELFFLKKNIEVSDYLSDLNANVKWTKQSQIEDNNYAEHITLMYLLQRPILTINAENIIANLEDVQLFSNQPPIFIQLMDTGFREWTLVDKDRSNKDLFREFTANSAILELPPARLAFRYEIKKALLEELKPYDISHSQLMDQPLEMTVLTDKCGVKPKREYEPYTPRMILEQRKQAKHAPSEADAVKAIPNNIRSLGKLSAEMQFLLTECIVRTYQASSRNSSVASIALIKHLQASTSLTEKTQAIKNYMLDKNNEGKKLFDIITYFANTFVPCFGAIEDPIGDNTRLSFRLNNDKVDMGTQIKMVDEQYGYLQKITFNHNMFQLPIQGRKIANLVTMIEAFQPYQQMILIAVITKVYDLTKFYMSDQSKQLLNQMKKATTISDKITYLISYITPQYTRDGKLPGNQDKKLYHIIETYANMFNVLFSKIAYTNEEQQKCILQNRAVAHLHFGFDDHGLTKGSTVPVADTINIKL